MEKFVKKNIGPKMLWECTGYERHLRGRNWVVELISVDEQFKLERKYIELITIDKLKYVELTEGGLYQFSFIYYTAGGKPEIQNEGFFSIRVGEMIELTQWEAIESLLARADA